MIYWFGLFHSWFLHVGALESHFVGWDVCVTLTWIPPRDFTHKEIVVDLMSPKNWSWNPFLSLSHWIPFEMRHFFQIQGSMFLIHEFSWAHIQVLDHLDSFTLWLLNSSLWKPWPIYRWFSQRTKPPFMVGIFHFAMLVITRPGSFYPMDWFVGRKKTRKPWDLPVKYWSFIGFRVVFVPQSHWTSKKSPWLIQAGLSKGRQMWYPGGSYRWILCELLPHYMLYIYG